MYVSIQLAFQHTGACLTLLYNTVEENLRLMKEWHTLGLFNIRYTISDNTAKSVWKRADTVFDNKFTKCLKTCFLNLWRNFHTMLKKDLHNIWRHFYTMFESMFTQYLKPCLQTIWRYICKCLKTFLHIVWRYLYTMFDDKFIQYLKTSLHNVSHFTQCLNACLKFFEGMST